MYIQNRELVGDQYHKYGESMDTSIINELGTGEWPVPPDRESVDTSITLVNSQ
jgi:hypothetical protein